MVQAQIATSVVPVQAGATYMISVTIRVGFGTISLKSDSLKSEAIAKALKENGVKSKDTLPIFEVHASGKKISLAQAGTALSTILDRLQSRYMICSGSKRWWFVAESDMPAIAAGLEEMEVERIRLLGELEAVYDDARDLFQLRLTNILSTANRMDEFDAYVRKFPAWQEIEQEFRIEIDGPVRVPSLTELAKQEPDMQKWMHNIHAQIERDLPKLVDDACGTAAEFLGRLEQVEPGNLNNTQANQLTRGQERLESLAKLYYSMCPSTDVNHPTSAPVIALIGHALEASHLCKRPTTTKDTLQEHLISLRSVLKNNELICGASKGAKALYEWVHGASVEQKIKAVVLELKQFQQELPGLSQDERRTRLEELKRKAESSAGVMSHAAGNLLTLLNNLLTVVNAPTLQEVEPEPESEPAIASEYSDEILEAGF